MGESTFGKGCHLHLIDGSAFIFRAYHALPPLTRKSDGLPVGAVSGFVQHAVEAIVEGNKGPDASDAPDPYRGDLRSRARTPSATIDLRRSTRPTAPKCPRTCARRFPLTRDATRAFNIACHRERRGSRPTTSSPRSSAERDEGRRPT
jgi:DNA polymerase I